MARIGGVNIPDNKRAEIALTYIYGIGSTAAKKICGACEIDVNTRIQELNEDQLNVVRKYISENYIVEGDLRNSNALAIKRLIEIRCYRGKRHIAKLPVRGQRTKTNARTRKGKRKAIANKKK